MNCFKKSKAIVLLALLQLVPSAIGVAHPGSGIVVDERGQVYFTDTGKGVWKLAPNGQLTFLPASEFHWMSLDEKGRFGRSPKSFGNYFERITLQSYKPTLIMCSDFPLVIGQDGNMYYADTRPSSSKIVRRTPTGNETVIASDPVFRFINGIACGIDGSLYITEASHPHANTVRKITQTGTMSTLATYAASPSQDTPLETAASYCRGLSVDSMGTIYVAATGSRQVLKLSPEGRITTILQTPSPWTPTGLFVFKGEIYVLEWHDVAADKLEMRKAWQPRVRKIGVNGQATILATISR